MGTVIQTLNIFLNRGKYVRLLVTARHAKLCDMSPRLRLMKMASSLQETLKNVEKHIECVQYVKLKVMSAHKTLS